MSTAIAYLRISSDPDDERFGVDRQRADVKKVAADRGLDLVEIYEDNDTSASKVRKENTAWHRVLRRLVQDPPDYLLCQAQDRLGRRMGDAENLEELCAATGTIVLNAYSREVFEQGNDSWLYEAATAKIEARKNSRRVRRAQADRVRAGKQPNGGRRPFGYAPNRMDKIEVECAVLQEMARRLIDGASLARVTHWLNDTGVSTVTGTLWGSQTLKRMLGNPRYVGDLAKFNRNTRQYVVIGEASWEPVFDRKTWDQLQAALGKREATYRGRPPVPTMLGGLLYCGACLHPMYRSRNAYKGTPDTYRCNRPQGGCGKVSRNLEALDHYVAQYILDNADPFALRKERDRLAADLKTLKHEEWVLSGKFQDAEVAYLEHPHMDWLLPEVNRFRDQWLASKRRTQDARLALERVAQATESSDRWRAGSVEDRRRWVRAHVAVVVCEPVPARSAFDPATVTITLTSEVPAPADRKRPYGAPRRA